MSNKDTYHVLDILYSVLNVSSVTSLLDGGEVWRDKIPTGKAGAKGRAVSIVPLPIVDRVNDFIRSGLVSVNCHVPDIETGVRDETNLKAISRAAQAVLEAYPVGGSFNFVIESQVPLTDNDNKNMSYVNMRLNYNIS